MGSIKDFSNKTIFTSLDLEMNTPKVPNTVGKIIQVGACIGDITTGAVFERFRRYVQIDEPLDERIAALTNITQEQLDTLGVSLLQAYTEVAALHKKHDSFINSLTWGGDDSSELQKQVWEKIYSPVGERSDRRTQEEIDRIPLSPSEALEGTIHTKMGLLGVPWVFGRRSFDVKPLYQLYALSNGLKMQGGLARSMVRLGLNFQGTKHDAGDDAFNTFRATHELVKRMRLPLNPPLV